MKTFLTSDWHIGETRFEIMSRPFDDVQQHVDALVSRHNEVVAPDDLVYVNGDVLYQGADPNIYLPQIARFNGRKILTRGNHDRPFSDEQFAPYFEQIFAEGEGIDVELEGVPCFIVHYPSLGKKNRFTLCGHIHSAWKLQLNSLNVGVDVNHFYPVDTSKIPFYLKAICEFYDADVWAAYNEINEDFKNKRGKSTSYFPLKV